MSHREHLSASWYERYSKDLEAKSVNPHSSIVSDASFIFEKPSIR